jgi:DNA-binding PadR family transcriptional regulator
VAKRRKVSNLLALALLSLLAQQPMYPYEMAQTLRARGKDKTIHINWGSLYTVVQNLEKHGFIEAAGTNREGRQPERTTYRITEQGTAELRDWLRELLSEPDSQPTPFAAALSEGAILPPAEVAELLAKRLAALDSANAAQEAELEVWSRRLPQVLLIESDYELAMRRAQADWVRGLLSEITEGTLGGVDTWRKIHETGEIPPEVRELDDLAKRGGTNRAKPDRRPRPGAATPGSRGRNLSPNPAVKTESGTEARHDCSRTPPRGTGHATPSNHEELPA